MARERGRRERERDGRLQEMELLRERKREGTLLERVPARGEAAGERVLD